MEYFLNGAERSLNSVNSANSENLINHWSMNWTQFKDPVSHICLADTVAASWSLIQDVAGWQIFLSLNSLNWVKIFSKQECIPIGCVPPTCCPYLPPCTAPKGMYLGVYLLGGTCWGIHARGTCLGGYLPGGVPTWGCTCQGVYLPRGSTCPGTPLPVDRILDTRYWKYYLASNFVCGR